jgi:hypothetical protein
MKSQATSGALHLVFLVLAFAAPPVAGVLDAPAVPVDVRRVEFEEPTPFRPQARFELTPGRRGPGEGPDKPLGPRPLAKVGPAEDADEPTLAGVAPTAFEDLTGAVAGVADQTLGPDTEMALGRLDGGGGSDAVSRFGMMGRGVSCARAWEYDEKKGEVVIRKIEGCKAAAMRGIGRGYGAAVRAAREAVPDLGDKEEVELGVTLGIPRTTCGSRFARACDWKEIIGRVIRRHRRELRYCWEQTLDRQMKSVDASVSLSFVLDPAGGRADVSILEESRFGTLDDCVKARAARWIFPETGERIRANYPFRFWSR